MVSEYGIGYSLKLDLLRFEIGSTMKIILYKGFRESQKKLQRRGGPYSTASRRVSAAIGESAAGDADPFENLPTTNHGESRIKDCVKYDLTGRCRLVTVQKDGRCVFLYVGTHDDCEKWINGHRGLDLAVEKDGRPAERFQSENLDPDVRIAGEPEFSSGKLYEELSEEDFDFLVEDLPKTVVRCLKLLESTDEETDILEVANDIGDEDRQKAVYDVFALLRLGRFKSASNRVASLRGDIVSPKESTKVRDGEDFKVINSSRDVEQFEHFIKSAHYKDWMMFMHPDQERIATAEFAGPAKLAGVSGSGKTCIVVKRAVTLAERYPDEEVLILTLNRPLAGLIKDLVFHYCAFQEVRDRIEILPFFELCQKFLKKFEPQNEKLYDDRTWKTMEHIDEVWREYYRCELNNGDAKCMQPVHDSLISQGIDAESYIREEFDWIRSAVRYDQRQELYCDHALERSGRSHPLGKNFRSMLLEGLEKWEKKMREVGITDYLGVATALYRHLDKLLPRYRCVLIDECQDFGTIELQIVMQLVDDGPDNLFFCGDAAQHVSWKHQSFKEAGIALPGARSMKVYRNYRNNRNILRAAYHILYEHLTEEMMEKEDFEILDPKLANFGGPSPLRLEADSLVDEIAYAVAYAESYLDGYPNRKACIAVCGYSSHQIEEFGKSNRIRSIPILEGTMSIDENQLFLSDLEQTKGFEFDLVCIVNACSGTIPNPTTPRHEQFRDLSKLYVAMTRAKLELILSYSDAPSPYLDGGKVAEHFISNAWAEHFYERSPIRLGVPPGQDHLHDKHLGSASRTIGEMSIEEFLYTTEAQKLSRSLISKLRSLGELANGEKGKADTLSGIANRINEQDIRKHFGSKAHKELTRALKRLYLH